MPNLGKLRTACIIEGREVHPPVGGSITRGYDQDYATADLTFPLGVLPSTVGQYDRILVLLGRDNYIERFDGYIVPWGVANWPARDTISCGDWLRLMEFIFPTQATDLAGMTGGEIVHTVLDAGNVPQNLRQISTSGKIISPDTSVATYWPANQNGAQLIGEIDEIENKRTWVDNDGVIHRDSIIITPFEQASFTFEQGVTKDIMPGTLSFEPIDPVTDVTIFGAAVRTILNDPEAATWHPNPFAETYARIQRELLDEGVISTQEVAAAVLARMNRNMIRASFPTWRDYNIQGRETIGLIAPKLRSNGNWWVQSVTVDWSGNRFRQTINTLSERTRHPNIPGVPGVPPIKDPSTGEPIVDKPPETPIPPGPQAVRPSFVVVAINRERKSDGSTLYDVSVAATSTSSAGTIVSHAWTASGPGAAPTTGTGRTATFTFTSLTGAQIGLISTDSLGNSNTPEYVRLLESIGVPVTARALFYAAGPVIGAFNGTVYNEYVLPEGTCQVVGNGGYWGVGDKLYRMINKTDYLQNAPLSTLILVGANIVSVWAEDIDNFNKVTVSFDDGRVGISNDGGATFIAVRDGPDMPNPVIDIFRSRFTGHIQAFTAKGHYFSVNEAVSWDLASPTAVTQPGESNVDGVLAPGHNWRGTTGGDSPLVYSEADTNHTFPDTPGAAAAVVPHIREDSVVFVDDSSPPKLYHTSPPGGVAMVSMTGDIGTVQQPPRGGKEDGLVIDTYYLARRAEGLKKIIRNAGANSFQVHLLRVAGSDSCNAGADFYQVATGIMATNLPPPEGEEPPDPTIPPCGTKVGRVLLEGLSSSLISAYCDDGTWDERTRTYPGMGFIAANQLTIWRSSGEGLLTLHNLGSNSSGGLALFLDHSDDEACTRDTYTSTGIVTAGYFFTGFRIQVFDHYTGKKWARGSNGEMYVADAGIDMSFVLASTNFAAQIGTGYPFNVGNDVVWVAAGNKIKKSVDLATFTNEGDYTGAPYVPAIKGVGPDGSYCLVNKATGSGFSAPVSFYKVGAGSDLTTPRLAQQLTGLIYNSGVWIGFNQFTQTGSQNPTATIYRSDDDGITWTVPYTGGKRISAVLRGRANEFWAYSGGATNNTLLHSDDGGQTWEEIPGPTGSGRYGGDLEASITAKWF